METILRIGLVICFYVFSASALVTHGQAAEFAEYYIYKDPYGRLVISNKLPPDGSSILKKHHLREPAEEVPQPQETADPKPNGAPENSPRISGGKAKTGEEITEAPHPVRQPGRVIDLMEPLRKSFALGPCA